jgi:hypothetical protein
MNNSEVLIEKQEGYAKQTFRNRCNIYGPNGKQALVIPVNRKNNTIITDVRIDYSSNWNKIHWKSIESAYNKSPFFIYYADYFIPFYSKKYTFLFDLNTELILLVLKLLRSETDLLFTKEFNRIYNDKKDYRNNISPKSKSFLSDVTNGYYHQVFNEKHGFLSDLSIIDLLFNRGNLSKEYLISLDI